MKKLYLISFAIILALTTHTLHAQIKVGVKAGANLYDNYQQGSKYFQSEANWGFHGGVFGDYTINEKFSARLEALYSTRGVNLSGHIDGNRIYYDRQANFIDFPISAAYTVMPKLRVHAGVVPSLFVDEYRSIIKNGNDVRLDESDYFRSYERWQFGVLVGASYDFALFGKNFEAGARYSMGLTNTFEVIKADRADRELKYMMVQAFVAFPIFEF